MEQVVWSDGLVLQEWQIQVLDRLHKMDGYEHKGDESFSADSESEVTQYLP